MIVVRGGAGFTFRIKAFTWTLALWKRRMLRWYSKTELCPVETADITVHSAFGNKPSWQGESRRDWEPAGEEAQKTPWSNYMDDWCSEASLNGPVGRKPGARLPWISCHSFGQCTATLITHIFGLTSHFPCKWDVLLWLDWKISDGDQG